MMAAFSVVATSFSIRHEYNSNQQHRLELNNEQNEANARSEKLSRELAAARVSLEDQARDCNARQIAEAERTKLLTSCIPDAATRKKAQGIGSHFERSLDERVVTDAGIEKRKR